MIVLETPSIRTSPPESHPSDYIVVHESVTLHVDQMTDSEIEWERERKPSTTSEDWRYP